jgi:CRP-like cAMP-binding protein
MTDLSPLQAALSHFTGLSKEDFDLSAPHWHFAEYKKGETYNVQKNVCKYMGFIAEGAFRSYIINPETGEEKNVFLYSSKGFVVTFKSFIQQIPCDYHTQALADSKVMQIHITDLMQLYTRSHGWEKFGRILAQEAFNVVMMRIEGFVFKSPEERYLDLIRHQPEIFNSVPLYHISSYLGIQGPSLSRIRKRLAER